jgi:hypothetical protein
MKTGMTATRRALQERAWPIDAGVIEQTFV